MTEQSIIKEFLDNNILLTPGEFKELNRENYRNVLEKKTEEKSVINEGETKKKTKILSQQKQERKLEPLIQSVSVKNQVKTTFGDNTDKKGSKLKITLTEKPKKIDRDKIKTIDVVSLYNEKYNAIREILSTRIDPLSINKIENTKNEVSVIGMVSQKTANGFTIEDETGSINAITTKTEDIENDDVIGLRGYVKGTGLFPEDKILPDIPLDNTPQIIDSEMIFDFSVSDQIKINDIPISLSEEVSLISVESDKKTMNILFYKKSGKTEEKEAINLLKKRCIKTGDTLLPSFFIIKKIPDIFIISASAGAKNKINYKGVTIITTGYKDRIKLAGEQS